VPFLPRRDRSRRGAQATCTFRQVGSLDRPLKRSGGERKSKCRCSTVLGQFKTSDHPRSRSEYYSSNPGLLSRLFACSRCRSMSLHAVWHDAPIDVLGDVFHTCLRYQFHRAFSEEPYACRSCVSGRAPSAFAAIFARGADALHEPGDPSTPPFLEILFFRSLKDKNLPAKCQAIPHCHSQASAVPSASRRLSGIPASRQRRRREVILREHPPVFNRSSATLRLS